MPASHASWCVWHTAGCTGAARKGTRKSSRLPSCPVHRLQASEQRRLRNTLACAKAELPSEREIVFSLFQGKKMLTVCSTSIGGMLWKPCDSQLPGFQDGRGCRGPGQQVTGRAAWVPPVCPGPAYPLGTEAVWPTPRACGKAGSEPGFPTGSKHLTA